MSRKNEIIMSLFIFVSVVIVVGVIGLVVTSWVAKAEYEYPRRRVVGIYIPTTRVVLEDGGELVFSDTACHSEYMIGIAEQGWGLLAADVDVGGIPAQRILCRRINGAKIGGGYCNGFNLSNCWNELEPEYGDTVFDGYGAYFAIVSQRYVDEYNR